ncbi:hypothetical protein [Zobellia uliginosa]|uniref:hypothetical protein n=1 Tax=Zobellia uliginosa TaxID=143224 RepID=UPI0026E1CEAA|nr:hypothetical protein [Zobellia uliginosa]MDO6516017.1 hypothetical protein [Zobellia uliginosa]
MSTNYNLERSLVAKVIMQDMFKVKAGESVAITADSGNDPELMNAFAAAVYAVGGKPLLMWTPKAKQDGQAGIKDWPVEALTAALSNVDVWLECNSTILLYSDIWENAFKNNKKLRYLIIADSSVQSLLRTFTGYKVPDLSKMLNKVRDMVLDCKTIRITSDNGTDVSYDINLDYSFDIDDGDFSMPKFGTAPGYVNIVPKVGSMNGTIVFDLLMNANVYGTDNRVEFIMKDGVISDVRGTAKEAENFKEYLASFNDPNMYKISHNMFGLNPSIRKMRGEIVEDERVWGGVDFGFGHTSPMDMPPLGQVAKSHFDGIVNKVSIFLDDIQIVKDGVYIHPELKPLAVKLIGEY